MVFSSLTFIFYFLPIFLFVYFLTPRRWKNSCLLAGSLLFYSFGVKDHPLYAALLLFSVFVNYRLGIRLGRRRKSGCRKGWLAAGIFYNLSWLVLFKYADYLEEELKACADMVDMLDAKMFSLNEAIMKISEDEKAAETAAAKE